MKHPTILKCPNCKSYALSEACVCGSLRVSPRPPKYSPEDKYGRYRRLAKQQAQES
ncbi:MAG: nucleolar RNA-binding Nop10p family protein [Nanoarchaeota archaeon]